MGGAVPTRLLLLFVIGIERFEQEIEDARGVSACGYGAGHDEAKLKRAI